jgi:hypothetical protein
MAFMDFSLRLAETIDTYDAAFRDSTLASNIELATPPARNGPAKEGRATVRFELSEQTRQAIDDYLKADNKRSGEFFPSQSRN